VQMLDESVKRGVSKRMMAHMNVHEPFISGAGRECETRRQSSWILREVCGQRGGWRRCVSGAGRECVKEDDGAHEASVVLDESVEREGACLGFFAGIA
jgi:hypothetical protein